MSNVLLAWPNLVDAGTLSGGGWQVALTNLQDRRKSMVARTKDLSDANTQFDMDLGGQQKQRVVAIVNHNMTTQGRYRLRVGNDATFAKSDYDSGWVDTWPVIYTPYMLEWEDNNWWNGKISDADRTGYPAIIFAQLDRIYLARYLRFEFDDQTNADGFLQFGRLFISPSWSPAVNASYGATAGWSTDTTSQRALGGTIYFNRKPGRRTEKFTFDNLTGTEAWSKVFDMQRTLGVDGEVLVCWDPSDALNQIRFSFIGHLTDLSPASATYFNTFSAPITIEELT